MKRFILSAIFVSVFCLGLSGLIDRANAELKSDDKAMQLIRASRLAIGGDQALAEVRSMTIKGVTTHFFERDGVQDVKQGTMEINFELPNRFSKQVKIGQPGDGQTNEIIEKDVDVIVERHGKDGKFHDKDGNVFVIRKGDGEDVEWNTDTDGKVKIDGDTVIIKREDGTVEKLKADGKHKIVVRKTGDGETIDVIGPEEGDVNVWNTDDGKKIRLHKSDNHFFGAPHRSNEMLRTTMALLLTAPETGDVSYKYIGEGNVDGLPSNVIEVSSHGSSFKLFLDAASNLPQMVSFVAPGRHFVRFKAGAEHTKEELMEIKRKHKKMRTHEIKFSDFRSVGGLLLPHRWTETGGGKMFQNVDITEYEVNPANIAERFKSKGHGKKMFVRKKKN